MKNLIASLSILALAPAGLADVSSLATTDLSAPRAPMTSAQIRSGVERLGVVGRALYIAAHPDDENTAMLSWLDHGLKVRTAYLSLTRGDGGQNLLGSEKGALLGLVRLQELLAARRKDGAEQFFTTAMDFGYSKSADETLEIWNREAVLSDVVWIIRLYKPDVIISRFPTTGEGGHGQHTASAILAREAFTAAADPTRFPEQLQHVTVWQTKRLLWNAFRPASAPTPAAAPGTINVDLGIYDPDLGLTYAELAGISRSMHKSQGEGTPQRRGSIMASLEVLDGAPVTSSLFDGVDLTWNRIEGSTAVQKTIADLRTQSRADDPSLLIPGLVRLLSEIDVIRPSNAWAADMLREKRQETVELITSAAGMWIEAITPSMAAASGDTIKVNLAAYQRAGDPLRLVSARVAAQPVVAVAAPLERNKPWTREETVVVNGEVSQPYWLAHDPVKSLYDQGAPDRRGRPEGPAPLEATFVFSSEGREFSVTTPVLYKWTDKIAGDSYRLFRIVPAVSGTLDRTAYVFASEKPHRVRLSVRAASGQPSGSAALVVPAGWSVNPASAAFAITAEKPVVDLDFMVTPPAGSISRTASLGAVLDTPAGRSTLGAVNISYPHLPPLAVFPEIRASLVRAGISTKGQRVGYVEGAGDEVAAAIEQLGYQVTNLTDTDIESGDLSKFDAIVTGVRAYNTRDVLKRRQDRLDSYVAAGGTLIVQYSTPDDTLARRVAPIPLEITRERVTREDAPVTFVDPAHPVLTSPNRISSADFDGWVQERGVWFAGKHDPALKPVLLSNDPGEPAKEGGLLVARYGKGAYVYSGYAFFRQLPAGVPGAYRLFANLLSLRGADLPANPGS